MVCYGSLTTSIDSLLGGMVLAMVISLLALSAVGRWQPLFVVVLVASVVGLFFTAIHILMIKKTINSIAFGPYLAFAGWIMMIWGDEIMNHYFALFGIN